MSNMEQWLPTIIAAGAMGLIWFYIRMTIRYYRGNYMKKLVFLFILLFTASANAADVTLVWEPNSESDLAGYRLYYGANSRGDVVKPDTPGEAPPYDYVIDVENVTEFTVTGVPIDVEYYYALTAYDLSQNESDFSDELDYTVDTVPPEKPSGLRILIERIISWLKEHFGSELRVKDG